MKRRLVGISLLVGIALAVPAMGQSRGTLGADGALTFPVGNFADRTGMGFGALARYEYPLLTPLVLTARTGFILSLGSSHKSNGIEIEESVNLMPFWGGVKYFVWESAYAAVELGLNLLFSSSNFSSTKTEAKLGLNVGGGYQINDLDLRLVLQMYDVPHAGDSFGLMFAVGYRFMTF